ncbi:MAG: oligoendopeptidase F [Lachnospiraceae bacterium]|nr:oligoendopeptidase F [Lachnospiraceae bacterium]
MRRSDQKKEDTWALEDLYVSEAAWEADGMRIEFAMGELEAFDGQITYDARKLLECLQLLEETQTILDSYYSYAMQYYHQDTTEPHYQALNGEAQIKANNLSASVSFIVPQILEISDADLLKYYEEEPELKKYTNYLNDIRRQKDHILDEKGEMMLASANEMAQAAKNIYTMYNNADVRFDDIKDENGDSLPLTTERYISYMESPHREVRKAAFESLYKTYKEHINTLAATFDANARSAFFYAKQRYYKHSMDAKLDDTNVPVSVYHNLIDAVHENLDTMYSYVNLRKRLLNVDELHMYDVYVPIVEGFQKKYSFEEAKEIVKKALAPLGDEYRIILEEGFEHRWIDVYENVGKRSGAYSTGSYGVHPYVLLNFQGSINHVFTLAHEMGHALHTYYSNSHQSFFDANYKIFVAEVASTVNEALLIHYLMGQTDDKKEQAFLINYFLDQFKGTIYRQTMFAEFELIAHDMVSAGKKLTADYLCSTYLDLNKKYFGPEMVMDEQISYEWARIPHFYTPFYVYQYATGFSAAIAISKRILSNEPGAVEDYKEFLSGGCSKSPIDLLRICGVDMESKEPVNQALAVFKEYLEKLEEIM